jgi:glyoxalase family protein
VDDAQADLDFAASTLGMRLVKKTVNFDNTGVYHFYYGDELGRPGTLWTTFPYRGRGVPVGTRGPGQVVATTLSVPSGSLAEWRRRLRESGYTVRDLGVRFGEEVVDVADPSGLVIELVASDDVREPWLGTLARSDAIRGLHSVTLGVREATDTAEFARDFLGFEVVDQTKDRVRMGVAGGGPGRTIDIATSAGALARDGLGTVHHVAFAVADNEAQLRIRAEVLARGIPVTPVMDRQYFRSIYFREPGGVLFEVATVGPGFTADEPREQLGASVKLPPWAEANRAEIEAALPVVRH